MKSGFVQRARFSRPPCMILLATGLLLRIQGHHLALIVIIIGIVMLAGSIIRFCPLYVVFGISTADRKTGAHPQ